jgi:hypothetical protein
MGPAELYPEEPSSQWLPPQHFPKLECMADQVFITDVYLTRLYSDRPGMGDLTQDQIDFVNNEHEWHLKIAQGDDRACQTPDEPFRFR